MEAEKIEKELQKIRERNERVEADKAWETSLARKILIGILTYAVVVALFLYAGFSDPFVSAFVPALGFFLSTITVPFFKEIWLERHYKKLKDKDIL